MTSVFRIHPNDLEKKLNFIGVKPLYSYSYDFLNLIKDNYDINVDIYYDLINSLEFFKFKNILYFMNFRLHKIQQEINYSKKISQEDLNTIFNDYIDKDIVKAIVVMNLLQQYIYPLK